MPPLFQALCFRLTHDPPKDVIVRRFRVALLTVFALAPLVPVEAQQFGGTMAVTGDQVLVGEAGNRTLSGLVYVYQPDGSSWAEVQTLSVTDALRQPDGFGRSLAAERAWLVVGAPLVNDEAGAAYVYRKEASGWVAAGMLDAGDAEAGARFGSQVAFREGVVLVSAPGADGGGRIHVFGQGADGGLDSSAVLTAPAGARPGLGSGLAFDGETVLAATEESRSAAAEVYAFSLRDGSQALGVPLVLDGLPPRSGFGTSMALADGVAFVGVPGALNGAGLVVSYQRESADSWVPTGELRSFLDAPRARFGSLVSPFDSGLLIGAPGVGETGTLFEFRGTPEGGWTEVVARRGTGVPAGGGFGAHVAMGEGLVAVAASGVDAGAGAAYLFGLDGEGWTQVAAVANEPRGFPALTGDEIHCVDGQADVFECKDVNVISFLPINELGGIRGTRVNDLWGWTDPESGREYVLVGRSNGTSFVDITDPNAPVYLGDLPMTDGSRDTIWRDIKVYRDHAYIVADNALEHGVQVFDLRRLRGLSGDPVTFEVDYLYDGIHSAHNIVINEETGYAFAVGNSGGGETCGGGLHMLDLSDPGRPAFAGCFAEPATGRRGTGYSHDAQCVVYHGPDDEHRGKEICFGANETALNIADVSDKERPVSLATASYPNVAYAHQGWLTEDHTFFYMNDEGDEPQGLVEGTRTLVWDVTDLDDPLLVREYIAETDATDHNLYVVGDLMYQSNYSAGLRILDISEPDNPVEIGFFDTSPYEGGASWSNYPFFESGVIAVTGTGDGLFLLKNMARRNLVP